MSEQLTHHERHEHKTTPEEHGKQQERLKELLEKAERSPDKHKERLPAIQRQAEKEAVSGKEYSIDDQTSENRQPPTSAHVNRELKHMALKRTLTRVQKRLSAPERVLSKAVHNPAVDQISRIGEKTIARPSGLLGGGVCAFIGSTLFLWAAKHYGFGYNYLLFVLFFVGGFVLGMTFELIIYTLRHKRI